MEIQYILLIVYLAVSALLFTTCVDMVLSGELLDEESGRRAGAIESTLFLIFFAFMSLVWPIMVYVGFRLNGRDT